jgi:hypothetical protein
VLGADIDNISMALKIRKQDNLSGEVALALIFLIEAISEHLSALPSAV